MIKIGIMSMQRIANYGSFLQSYGLKKMLESYGNIDVSFIDYKPGTVLVGTDTSKKSKVVELLFSNSKFVDKIKYYRHKKTYGTRFYPVLGVSTEPNYDSCVDMQVIGSDEVFNCIQSNPNVGFSPDLFGYKSSAKRLISYAGSFGNTTAKKIDQFGIRDQLKTYFNAFDDISVRDNNSLNLVSTLTDHQVTVNIDPVLAYDFMRLESNIPKQRLVKNKYLIIYGYSGRFTKQENKDIKDFAKKMKLEIVSVGGPQRCASKYFDCSPFEVLALFRDAEFVITDTFHGTIFSIINNTKFCTVVRKSNDLSYGNEEKLTYLLDIFNLRSKEVGLFSSDRLIQLFNSDFDYDSVGEILSLERQKTGVYLKKNIDAIKGSN